MTASDRRAGTDDLWEAMYTQRAIRRWVDRPVPEELLWRVLEAATRAPSGSNLQPWRFVVVQDAGRRAAIARLLREQTQPIRPAARSSAGAPLSERSQRLMLAGAASLREALDAAPVLIIPCLYGLSSPTTDVTSLLAGSSIYGAVQNLMLAARGLGLGTVLTTFHRVILDGLRRELGIPDDATPVALIPLGFPAANFGPTTRRPVEEVTFWDNWGTVHERRAAASPRG